MASDIPFLERFKHLIFALLAAVMLVGISLLLFREPEPLTITIIPPEPTLTPSATLVPSATPTPGPYAVYITGAVLTPQIVVTLPFGSRVLDVVAAAGGALESADLERVNLAQRVQDGDHVHLPTREGAASLASIPVTAFVVTATPGEILVYVVGAVARSESLVSLPNGSRVEEAIAAAGGTLAEADLARVNLGQILHDGDLVFVPSYGESSWATPTPNHIVWIHVNYASAQELETLPGIGPALAQAIVTYRQEHGPFANLESMDAVPGLGITKLNAIREYLIFD